MKKLTNMTTHSFDLEHFGNNAGLKEFLRRHSLDGLELMEIEKDEKQIFKKKMWSVFIGSIIPAGIVSGTKTPGLLLEQVKYPRKGIMLDIGHLLHTNTALRTEEDAVKYLREVLGRYEDLSIILGVHYHQTLEGAFIEEIKRRPEVLKGSYRDL